MREVVVDGSALTIDDVVAVARGQARASLGPEVARRMEASRSVVVQALSGGAPVYGVNTGFGALVDTPISEADLTTLQGAIVRSHSAATGEPLDDQTVRAVLLLRARTLAAGYSGVRADLPAHEVTTSPAGHRDSLGEGGAGTGELHHDVSALVGCRLADRADPVLCLAVAGNWDSLGSSPGASHFEPGGRIADHDDPGSASALGQGCREQAQRARTLDHDGLPRLDRAQLAETCDHRAQSAAGS